MKLLGWMHRKLRQNNNDVFKEFTTSGGGTCNSITGLASPGPAATFLASAGTYFPDTTSTDLCAFGGSGLLTIGTLGFAAVAVAAGDEDNEEDYYCDVDVHPNNNDDTTPTDEVDGAAVATPTFTYPPPQPAAVEKPVVVAVEAIAEKDDDTTTEDDLMVVSAELEKVLGGRTSGSAAVDLVASARASFATGVDCPLQSFLFGSPVSDVESHRRDSVGGGRRTSLGELFMRTRFADEKVALVAVEEDQDGNKTGGDGERVDKGGGGGKVMKRKMKSEKSAGGDGAPATGATKSKFQKILQIFHRKVYPESTALTRNLTKKCRKRGGAGSDEPPASSTLLQCRKEPRLPGFGCCANRSSFGGGASPDVDDEHNGGSKSGHWIRTDADYLVLEL